MIDTNNENFPYSALIRQALSEINRGEEYADDDEGRKNDYNMLFLDALEVIIGRSADIFCTHSAKLQQGVGLSEGMAYLPNDFLAFYDKNQSHLNSVFADEDGRPYSSVAGQAIHYVRMPKHINELPIFVREAVKLQFLSKCEMRDAGFLALQPTIRDKLNAAIHRLDSEVYKAKSPIYKKTIM